MKKLYFILFAFLVFGGVEAQIINFPNINFKAKLLSSSSNNHVAQNLSGNYFKIDANNDGDIQVSEALQVSGLDVNSSSCSDLTGIEYFTNLKYLYCYYNQIHNFNLTALINLLQLNCSNNLLSNLNINMLTNLQYLDCSYNTITDINSQISSLINLQTLECSGNQISNINLGLLPNLINLYCGNNQLSSIDASSSAHLTGLCCYGNNLLTSLNIKNGHTENLCLNGDPNLHNICADASDISYVQNSIASYGYTCTVDSSCALYTNEFQEETAFKVFPNPTKNRLIIEYNIEQNIQLISIYNTLGQVVFVVSNPSNIIDVSSLNTGNYFIKVITDKGSSSGKFIKE